MELECGFGVDAVTMEETASTLAVANSGHSLSQCGLPKFRLCNDPQPRLRKLQLNFEHGY